MKKIKILFIDTCGSSAILFQGNFLEYGEIVEIKTAANCLSAWELYNSFKPDLITIQPYGIGGIQFIKDIREQEYSEGIKTAVIAITSQNLFGDKEKYLLAGFDSYVPKPVNFIELKKEILRCVPKFSALLEAAKNKPIPCRVLTVTADPLMRAFLVKPLEKKYPGGAMVDITERSNEAMNFLHKLFSENIINSRVDVVLIDLDLPGHRNGPDAYQLSMLIKTKYPEIITAGLTTFPMLDSKKQCLQSGMDFLFDVSAPNEVLVREITKALYPV